MVQLREKAEKSTARREEDKALMQDSKLLMLELAEARVRDREAQRVAAKTYGEALRGQMLEHRCVVERHDSRAAIDGTHFTGTSIQLKSASSDWDTEAAFRRELHEATAAPALRGNNSESVGPLLGFAAPFATTIIAKAAEQ